jgi:ABC-type branched-subunit amino acid transport system substrate-binding protein
MTWRLVALAGASVVVLAACGSNSGSSSSSSAAAGPESGSGTPLYLVDGNVGLSELEALPPGTLTGVQGTLPGAETGQAFKDALNSINPKLKQLGYSYAPETYDAVTLIALAAVQAKSDAGRDIAKNLRSVSEGGTACTSFKQCNDLLKQGKDIDYNGQSGPVEFDQFGDPTVATIGIYEYNSQNKVDGYNAPATDTSPDFQEGELTPSTDAAPKLTSTVNEGASDNRLTIGSILPITGSLASLGPPEIAGAQLATQDINQAGGVLGKPAKFILGDSGDTTTDTASKTVDKQLKQGVDAIVGAASSSVSLSVIDKITGAGVVQFSPANTSPELSTYPDGGMYFRTAPSDQLQGRVLGNLITGEGYCSVGILALQDSYGEGLASYTEKSIQDGGCQVTDTVFYDPNATSFNTEVSKIKANDPDSIVLIGFNESAKVVQELVKQGIGPNS